MELHCRDQFLLLFTLILQVPPLLAKFDFFSGDNQSPFGPPKNNGKTPFFEMSTTFNFSFEPFMKTPPFWLIDSNLGTFIFKGLNLFLKKGIFPDRDSPPFNYQPPDQIFKGTDLSISPEGEPYENILTIFENVFFLSPHRAHPWYFKRDSAGLCPYATIGDFTSYLHLVDCNEGPIIVFTYWVVGKMIIIKLRILIGYVHADGVMTINSGMSNIAAVHVALTTKYPEYAIKGMPFLGNMLSGPKNDTSGYPAVFICEGNHNALKLFGMFGGVPKEYLVEVKMDKEGRMDVEDLETQIKNSKQEGRLPFMIFASMGSTALGAVDPIDEIADIAEEYDLWFHLDGAHGGPCMFSDDFRKKWPGIERSNSITFDFTGLLGNPHAASYLIIRTEGLLDAVWSLEKMHSFASTHITAELYNSPKFTDSGKTFIQWIIRGNRGYRHHIDYTFKMTRALRKKMKNRENYELLTSESDTPVVAFRIIPTPPIKKGDDYVKEMDKFTKSLQLRLMLEGFIYITITRVTPTQPKHFIMSLANSILTDSDLDYVLDKIDCLAKKSASCPHATWKRIGKASPMAETKDGYAPYVNTITPDLHLPFFIGLFKLVINVDIGIGPDNRDSKPDAVDLTLNEMGLKKEDITPYIEEFSRMVKSKGTLGPTSFNDLDRTALLGIMAEFVLTMMAPSMDSYESSPPFMVIKEEVETLIRTRVGYPHGKGDGTVIPPSGDMDPMFVINLAKFNLFEKKKKPKADKLVFFVSSESHFSWKKAASKLGLGMENCIYVPADEGTGKMSAAELKKAIKKSKKDDQVGILVVATLGTDVLGALDPFQEIRDVCTEEDLWLHIDGRNGGPLIFSDNERKNLEGIESSDSFSFGPSEFYKKGATDRFSVLVTRKEGILKEMMNKDKKGHDDDDDATLNSGRTAAEFKFWIVLKQEGLSATGKRIDQILKTTQNGIQKMKKEYDGAFKIIQPKFELNSICFQYLPKKYREETDEDKLDLVQLYVASVLKKNKVYGVYYTNTSAYTDGKYGFLKIEVKVPEEPDLFEKISKIHKAAQDSIVPKDFKREKDEGNKFNAKRAEYDGKVYEYKEERKTYKKTTSKNKNGDEETVEEEEETTVKKSSKKPKKSEKVKQGDEDKHKKGSKDKDGSWSDPMSGGNFFG